MIDALASDNKGITAFTILGQPNPFKTPKLKYCSVCGSDKLSFAIPDGDNRERHICGNCATIHYINPRIIVGVLARFNDKVLLCRRAIEPRKDFWNLPAGFLENGETAEDGAVREVFEESLALVRIDKLHCVYSVPGVNQVFLHYLGTMLSENHGITSESTEVKLLTEQEIPWEDIAFSSTEFALKKYFEDPGFEGVHIGSWTQ